MCRRCARCWEKTSEARRRNVVTWAIEERGYSQSRAYSLAGIVPRLYRYRYRSSRPDDTGLRERLRELTAERRRFGYRQLHLC